MSNLILGVATNSKGHYKALIDGKITKSYGTWQNMLRRAYCPKLHAINPTYIGCSVVSNWLEYQRFAEWFENHEYSNHGYQLDKDILLPDNKIYAPSTVCFVPRQLNTLLVDSGAIRGKYPQGVYLHKSSSKFKAQIAINGKGKSLGYYDTPQEAYQVYKKAKEAYVKEKALEWQDRIADEVYHALMQWTLDDK